MTAALDALQNALHDARDDREKGEIRRAMDILKRGEQATDISERPDFRSPDFKQIANEPETGEELANAVARTNRMEGELPQTLKIPTNREKTPPPIEAGAIGVQVDGDNGRRTVTVAGDGQPSKPADVPANSDGNGHAEESADEHTRLKKVLH